MQLVCHPKYSGYDFINAVDDGHAVLMSLHCNWKSDPVDTSKHVAHAVLLYRQTSTEYIFKNTSHYRSADGGTEITIPKSRPPYWFSDSSAGQRFVASNPDFTDENYLMYPSGYMLQFKAKYGPFPQKCRKF